MKSDIKKIIAALSALALFVCLLVSCTPAATVDNGSDPSGAESGGTDSCIDGECDIPDYDDNGNQVYKIVSPVGYHNVDMIEQAPRLDTLDGKTIALVGGSFMASVTHNELKKCILETYPTCKVYMFNEVGSGGPYSVFNPSTQTVSFQNKLKELKIDAVISGNCGCGLCTTKESGSAIAAEYIGIPTVTVGAPTFIAQIHSTGVNRGVPVLRTAEYPGAFASHSTEELIDNARNILWPQIIEGFTKEITQAEINLYANAGELPYDEIIHYGSYEDVQDFMAYNEWTDGLPVVPPTDEKIREYLKYTPHKADEELGTYALAYRKTLVYTVAANAVMSGVPKEFMPICIAMVQALANGEWRRPLASTHGWSPYAWLNGPLARQLGIDSAQGMISEENNKALGRFMDLVMLNIGGYYVKENRMGTFGYLTPWTFSENEEACLTLGWDPYHVTQGYALNSNTITAASALSWGNNVTPATDDAEMIMTLMAWDITEKQQNGLGNTNPQVYRTVFITEDVARDLALKYESKSELEDDLIKTARRPLWMRTFAHYWANTGSQQFNKRTIEQHYQMLLEDSAEKAELTDTPEWLRGFVDDDQIMTIATMLKGQTPLLITGDNDRNKFMTLPGGGYVTIGIDLPENWNELVAEGGYEPIENFYLDPNDYPEFERTQRNNESGEQDPGTGTGTGTGTGDADNNTSRIDAPSGLSDGTYRVVPSLDQLTEAGRVHFSSDSVFTYWKSGASSYTQKTLSSSGSDKNFLKFIRAMGFNCSFTVKGGKVTEIILRPSTVTRKLTSDVSALTSQDLANIKVTLAANTKQSKEAGAVSVGGATVIISSTVKSLVIDLDGAVAADKGNTGGFVKISGSKATIDSSAASGAKAKIGVKLSDGKYRTFTFTKNSNNTVSIDYNDSDTLNP